MTREEQTLNGFTEMMKGFWNNQNLKVPNKVESKEMAVKTLEQESSGDCISRQAVLDLCDKKTKYDIPYEYYEGKKHIRGWDEGKIINFTKLMQLPSIMPWREMGCKGCKYEETGNNTTYPCSHCGRCYTDKYKAESEKA